jgi:hypothetical protein
MGVLYLYLYLFLVVIFVEQLLVFGVPVLGLGRLMSALRRWLNMRMMNW